MVQIQWQCYSMMLKVILSIAIVARSFDLSAALIDYESMYQNAFVVPSSSPYNSVIGSTAGLTSSAYVDDSRRRLESDHGGLRVGFMSSMKNLVGVSPSPAYRGWSGTLERNVPQPYVGPPPTSGGGGNPNAGGGPPSSGGSSSSPTVSSGWQVEFTGIPDYSHTMTQDDIDTLNNRQHAFSDFTSGHTTATVGQVVTFAEDIGYSTTNGCEYGYWPPGPVCPAAYSGSWLFSLAPAPEMNEGGCYVSAAMGYLVNGVPFWSWTDGNSYNDQNVWNQLAGVFEQTYDMDICGGHSAQAVYHHHAHPNCLADNLNDDGTAHSPIYGFAYDSYPLYGPYQDNGLLAVSCWQKRDYSSTSPTGCSDSQRSCQLVDQYDYTQGVTTVSSGPNTGGTVSTSSGNTISSDSGLYFEDYFWNSTCSSLGSNYLDDHNGHSHGTLGYHYHITMDSSGIPTFPYTVGPKYYGCKRYGDCALNYKFTNQYTSDSTCGESESTSPIPGSANSTSTSSSSSSASSKTLSSGAIAGIVIGGVAVLILIAVLIWFVCFSAASAAGSAAGGGGAAYSAANQEVAMVPTTSAPAAAAV